MAVRQNGGGDRGYYKLISNQDSNRIAFENSRPMDYTL